MLNNLKQYALSIYSTHDGVVVVRTTDHRTVSVYHPDVYRPSRTPIITTPRISQTAKIVSGRAVHLIYLAEPLKKTKDKDHDLYTLIDDEWALVDSVALVAGMSRIYMTDMEWDIDFGVLQETVPCSLCVIESKLREVAPDSMQLRIVVPAGEQVSIEPLLRDTDQMWDVVEDALK